MSKKPKFFKRNEPFHLKQYFGKQSVAISQITLDWDNIDALSATQLMADIWYRYNCRQIAWRRSARGNGYHVKILLADKHDDLITRVAMHDDIYRVWLDAARPPAMRGVLWDRKKIGGKIHRAGSWVIAYP